MEDEICGECTAVDFAGITDCEIKSPRPGVLNGSKGSHGERTTATGSEKDTTTEMETPRPTCLS